MSIQTWRFITIFWFIVIIFKFFGLDAHFDSKNC